MPKLKINKYQDKYLSQLRGLRKELKLREKLRIEKNLTYEPFFENPPVIIPIGSSSSILGRVTEP